MDPSPSGSQQVVKLLQQQLLAKDAEIQRQRAELQQKIKEVQLKEAEIQRLTQEQRGENCIVCAYTVWLWDMHWVCRVVSGILNINIILGAGPDCVLLI